MVGAGGTPARCSLPLVGGGEHPMLAVSAKWGGCQEQSSEGSGATGDPAFAIWLQGLIRVSRNFSSLTHTPENA